MKYIFIALVLVIFINSCLTDSNDNLPEPQPVSAYEIKSVNVRGRYISIVAGCGTPESCWAFNRTSYSRSNNTFLITVFAQRTTNDPCLQVISSIDARFNTIVNAPGTYTFRFWRNDGTTVDTTLNIR